MENANSGPLSLEATCLHILRVFVVLARTLEGFNHPFVHPTKGLNLEYILDLAWENEKSKALVQNLLVIGWALFSSIHADEDTFNNLHADTFTLFGYDPSK